SRSFLNKAQKNGEVVVVTQDLPKSFVVVSENKKKKVYITNVSPATLTKRAEQGKQIEEL
ncbi:MAG: hypothetical protein II510_08220, partial [Erysipelotrichales bacterium]|nr:hypothetical protein [Erysipelotrichales bacterium]